MHIMRVDKGFFVKKKKLGFPYGGSLVLEKKICHKFTGFIHLQFIDGRNYVIPSVQWSKTGSYPDEAESVELQLALFNQGKTCDEVRDELPQGWLRATDFGKKFSHFEIIDEKPPRSLIRAAYSTPQAKAVLSKDPFLRNGEWENNPDFDNWETMYAITGIKPSANDAERVVKDLFLDLSKYVEFVYIPFLNSARICMD